MANMNRVTVVKGNALQLATSGHVVHGCNSMGVMGSGIALGVKQTYPLAYEGYHTTFLKNDNFLQLGSNIPVRVSPDLYIHNAITQSLYGRDGKRYVSYDAIADSLTEVNQFIMECDEVEKTLSFPKIGCGLGGGNWDIVLPIIVAVIDPCIKLVYYEYK